MGVILHGVCYDTHMMTTALLVALLLGQTITPVKVTDPTQPSSAVTTTPVATKRGLDVNVIGGGAGGGAVTQATTPWITQDNHTTAVAPLACRLTDGASFYTAGGSTGLTDAQLRATPVPVSGTFWQTTQPVSWAGQTVGVTSLPGSPAQEHTAANSPNSCRLSDGAAFVTTLPVSLASVPSHAVTGSGNFTVVQPTGTNLHVVVDSAPTTPVTGTFWQATQPVSSTQLPAALGAQAVGASMSVVPATASSFTVAQPTGTNLHVVVDTAPTTAVTGPLTDAQLRATAVPVSGSVTATVTSTTVTNTVATKVSKVAAAPLATAVTVTGSATALPASVLTNRVSLCVYNNGASTMYLGPAGVTTANGLPLPAGGSFCDDVGAQVYYAVVAAGSVEARVLEN